MSYPLGLTVEEFWQYPGCGHYTREEAEDILIQLRRFAEICYQVYRQKANAETPGSEGSSSQQEPSVT